MGSGRPTVVAAVLALVAGLAGLGLGLMGRTASVAHSEIPTQELQSETFEVHVAGWVVEPGVVSVHSGSIVADAIELAGGLKVGADSTAINLAAALHQGDQVIVPGLDQTDGGGSDGGVVSLNRATVEELQDLPGVGPVLATRIVDHREANGRFETVEDLLEVPGIGEAKLASLRDLVRP